MYNGYYYGFDMTYLVLVVPALLIALIAQIQVKSAFSRYAGVRCTSGLTGAQAAQQLLVAERRIVRLCGVRPNRRLSGWGDVFLPERMNGPVPVFATVLRCSGTCISVAVFLSLPYDDRTLCLFH